LPDRRTVAGGQSNLSAVERGLAALAGRDGEALRSATRIEPSTKQEVQAIKISKLDDSCISNPEIPKSQIGPREQCRLPVQFKISGFQDLKCRNRPISKFLEQARIVRRGYQSCFRTCQLIHTFESLSFGYDPA
jgi:hypothetical protein